MFNDFDGAEDRTDGKGRRAASLGVAILILVVLGSGVAAALATVRVVQQQRDQDVTFEDLPLPPPAEVEETPPPPPPPPPRRTDRPAGERPVLDGPPSGIPNERPEEMDGELASADNVGPIENDAEMGEGGEGPPAVQQEAPAIVEEEPRPTEPPPAQVRETIRRARYLADASGCRRIILPDAVAAALGAQTVRIRIRALVDPSGRVQNATVTEGHELIPEDTFIECAEQWAFEPATLPDGTAVPYPAIRTFVIRPRT